MYFNRSEFDRYVRFHSWGSSRESFSWAEMSEVLQKKFWSGSKRKSKTFARF